MTNCFSVEFEQHYHENQIKVYNLAFGLIGNASDAEEITQEAFYRALKSYGSFRGESSFFTWIYRITLNVANDYMKQRAKMPMQALTEDYGYQLSDIIDEDPEHNPETEILAKEARYRCLHCITECMPTEQRKMFCLAITLGLPYKMVADILECSLSKVKTTICRAKKRWFGYMENRCDLIKKSNPCNCSQWVRFGLEQGWISLEQRLSSVDDIDLGAVREIKQLKVLRDAYAVLYPKQMDEAFSKRIKAGIEKKEWKIIS